MNEDEAVEFLLQILKGVKHMHQKSIVHLDLKVRLQILKGETHAPEEHCSLGPQGKTPDIEG